jgi:transposase
MNYNFLPYAQDQDYLLPPSLKEWVREDSLAQFISDAVDHLDARGKLQRIYAAYRADGWGRAAYHPAMMVKLLLYAYAVGIRSSREIERSLHQDVAFRFLAANQTPNFRTISDFRKDHLESLQDLFTESLEVCAEAGLVKLGRVALDGRKVRGNAALDRNRRRKDLEKEVARILKEAAQKDEREDRQFGLEMSGEELPANVRPRKQRLEALEAALERLANEEEKAKAAQQEKIRARADEERTSGRKKRGRKPKAPEDVIDPEAKANLTDPDSRIMKTRRGWVQGYNGQAMVDCETQVIVAQALTQDHNDVQQLEPMLQRCQEQVGRTPEQTLADAGYWSEQNAALAEPYETDLFIATAKDWKQREAIQEAPPPRGRIRKNASRRERMERKLLTKAGREIYKQRAPSVECVFGQMHGRGLNEFLLRSFKKASGEWSLFCTTHNLLKAWRAGWRPLQGTLATAVP